METKICKRCGIEKKLIDYSIKKINGKEYFYSYCKKCASINSKEYRMKNHNLILEREKKYREKNHEAYLQKAKKWRQNNLEYTKKYRKEYYLKNRDLEIKRAKQYQESHKEILKEKHKIYIEKNKEKIKKYNKEWEEKNKEYRNKYNQKLKKEKMEKDNIYKLKVNIRHMINASFKRKRYKKNQKSEKIIGCNTGFFADYLLQTYKKNYGYEWDGKEKVHIDHIIPLSEAKTEQEVIKLCHYKNLQLLKAKDNLQKYNKLNWELQK